MFTRISTADFLTRLTTSSVKLAGRGRGLTIVSDGTSSEDFIDTEPASLVSTPATFVGSGGGSTGGAVLVLVAAAGPIGSVAPAVLARVVLDDLSSESRFIAQRTTPRLASRNTQKMP